MPLKVQGVLIDVLAKIKTYKTYVLKKQNQDTHLFTA